MKLPVTIHKLPQKVSDLWMPRTQLRDKDLISKIFDDQAADCIANIQVVPSENPDRLRWMPAKKGICTSKEAFSLLSNNVQEQLVQHGALTSSTRNFKKSMETQDSSSLQ